MKYGLTPQQALAASAINGPAFLGAADRFGELAVGMTADVVLLDRNPLDDIRATRALNAVVLKGRSLDRAALTALTALTARDVTRSHRRGLARWGSSRRPRSPRRGAV